MKRPNLKAADVLSANLVGSCSMGIDSLCDVVMYVKQFNPPYILWQFSQCPVLGAERNCRRRVNPSAGVPAAGLKRTPENFPISAKTSRLLQFGCGR